LAGRIQELHIFEGYGKISLRLVELKEHQAIILVSEDAGDGLGAGKAHSFVKLFDNVVFVEI